MGESGDFGHVHWLVSTFRTAAEEAFEFLGDHEYAVTYEHDVRNPPSRVAVRFEGDLATVVESELTMASDGGLTLRTFVRAHHNDHLLDPSAAHDNRGLSGALEEHARQVRDILGLF